MNDSVIDIEQCISAEERRRRPLAVVINILIWLFLSIIILSSWGLILFIYLIILGFNRLVSTFDVKKLRALGVTVSEDQFPDIYAILKEVCYKFDLKSLPTLIVIDQSENNCFAIRYSNKNVILLYSHLLECIRGNPNQIRFVLGHEIAHLLLAKRFRNRFELLKLPSYRAARELTCDIAGVVVANDVESSIKAMKILSVGDKLYSELNTEKLVSEAAELHSGFTGWLLKIYSNYPLFGKRVLNMRQFGYECLGQCEKSVDKKRIKKSTEDFIIDLDGNKRAVLQSDRD